MSSEAFTRPPVANFVYKITPRAVYEAEMKGHASYAGSAMDQRDGFVHLSQAHQVLGTLGRFYAGQFAELVVLKISVASLDAECGAGVEAEGKLPALRYEFGVPRPEGADHDQLFPHLFAPLPMAAVVSVIEVAEGEGGAHVLPHLEA